MGERSRREARMDKGENERLRGTFASVLIIGGFILASWLFMLGLYLARQ
jgi:hypothetical protein